MKTSPECAASERPSGRYVPSGVHRIELEPREHATHDSQTSVVEADADTHVTEPTTSRIRPIAAPVTATGRHAVSPRRIYIAPAHLAIVLSVVALFARWVAHDPWVCNLIALSPLCLIVAGTQRATWSVYAGGLWLMLALIGLLHPMAAADARVSGVLSLAVLGLILLSTQLAYRSMQELSRRDPLTKLLNRRGFEEFAAQELKRATRYDRPISFALIDVDRFKEINDHYGHAAGDHVLQLVAAQLRQLRNSDLAVRLGGDEFGLLMPETDRAGAELLVARLMQRIEAEVQDLGWPVTLSVGIADSQTLPRHLDVLIAGADERMYDAKTLKRTAAR